MNILMTGGTGLIGRCFIRHYNHHQFTVLTRSPKRAKKRLPNTVLFINCLSSLENLNEFDAVINLAGERIIDKRWTEKQKAIICESRWHITQQLVDLFKLSDKPPEVFLSGSAIGIYGDQGETLLTEDYPIKGKDFASSLCQRWESIAKQAESNSRVVYLRTGIVLSPHGGALAKMILPFKCYLGGRIGTGKHYMSWIHYQDMIDAMEYLLHDRQVSGAVNMVAPESIRNQTFTDILAATLNRFAIFPAPKFLLQWLLGESSHLLLDSQKVFPKKLTESQFKFSLPNLKLALADLLQDSTQLN